MGIRDLFRRDSGPDWTDQANPSYIDDDGNPVWEIPPDDVLRMQLARVEEIGLSRIAEQVSTGHRNRGFRLFKFTLELIPAAMAMESALEGLDEVSARLTPEFPEAAELVQRAREDAEIGLDALLTGRRSLIIDVSRDLMEIEFLLLDFGIESDRASQWGEMTDRQRGSEFGFGKVRKRVADWIGIDATDDMPDAVEYRSHSRQMHPSPVMRTDDGEVAFGDKAITTDSDWLPMDTYELLTHVRRVLCAADGFMELSEVTDGTAARIGDI